MAHDGEVQARVARLLGFVAEAPAWRGQSFAAVVAHASRGLGRDERQLVLYRALETVDRWGTLPAARVAAGMTEAELARLPPLAHRADWAAYFVAAVVIDRMTAANAADDEATPQLPAA